MATQYRISQHLVLECPAIIGDGVTPSAAQVAVMDWITQVLVKYDLSSKDTYPADAVSKTSDGTLITTIQANAHVRLSVVVPDSDKARPRWDRYTYMAVPDTALVYPHCGAEIPRLVVDRMGQYVRRSKGGKAMSEAKLAALKLNASKPRPGRRKKSMAEELAPDGEAIREGK